MILVRSFGRSVALYSSGRRTPPSTPCPPAIRGPTPAVSMGSRLLDLVVTELGELAIQSRHRAARDRSGVAPPRLPALLAEEVQRQADRPAEARPRASPSDPAADGTRESDLGPSAHSGRIRLAGLRGRRAGRCQVHAPDRAPTLADVGHLSGHNPRDLVAIDCFLVSTLTFRPLFVFVVLRHDRREILHLNATDHPTAVWTLRQLTQAFPEDMAPKYLLRDRDGTMARSSHAASSGWRFARSVSPRDPLGKTPSWSGSSDPSAASAWMTSSC